MSSNEYDIIIVGAGPAGSAAALHARRLGLRAVILEKERFPRDKICGDAISGKSIKNMEMLGILDEAGSLPGVTVNSITFGSPSGQKITIPLSKNKRLPAGFVIRRQDFDHFLFEKVKESGVEFREQAKVTNLLFENGRVNGVRVLDRKSGKDADLKGRLILGADGYNSIVARKTGLYRHEPEHWVVALRCYYRNIRDVSPALEVYYSELIQPGYFWIFPLHENMANVGIGMHHSSLKKRGVDLRESLQAVIASPQFRDRFKGAEPMEKPVGWNLPVASRRRRSYGDGFMLLGDAAGLIDPFTGEGIGNALTSAWHATERAAEAIRQNRFDAAFLATYEDALWDEIGNELQVSTRLQKVGRFRILLNFVIGRAARNSSVSDIISGMMANQIPKKQLANPLFYLKLLFM